MSHFLDLRTSSHITKRALKQMCIDFLLGVARNIGSKIICIMYRYKSGAKEGWRIGGESRMNDSDENTA